MDVKKELIEILEELILIMEESEIEENKMIDEILQDNSYFGQS